MIDKVNVASIVRSHFATFRAFNSQKAAPGDYLLFLAVPVGAATLLAVIGVDIPSDAVGILATALSVFASLFFSLLILVVDLAVRSDEAEVMPNRHSRVEGRLIRELHANVAFAILMSVAALVGLVALSLRGSLPGRPLLEGVVFFLCIQFFLTLLMILKRASGLIGNIVKTSQRKAS